ncbi:hypothetical protein ID866_5873 [Astraeus odoratus]|nr:hypothetical protein ID866_5873 [Astraeus odoratus]
MHDEDVCADVEYFSEFLWAELEYEVGEKNLQGSLNVGEVQLVVEPRADTQGVLCSYYFVNPAGRSLFWLDDWESPSIFGGLKGVETLSHKGELHRLWTILSKFRLTTFHDEDSPFKPSTGTSQW